MASSSKHKLDDGVKSKAKYAIGGPYRHIFRKLTDTAHLSRPRRKAVVNVWRKTNKGLIESEVWQRVGTVHMDRKDKFALSDQVACELFDKLTLEEKDHWEKQTQDEYDAALAKWKREAECNPSQNPEDQKRSFLSSKSSHWFSCFLYRYIQSLADFARPLLNCISEATGWDVTLLSGGLEPAGDGRLNVTGVHSAPLRGQCNPKIQYVDLDDMERAQFQKNIADAYRNSLLQKSNLDENEDNVPILAGQHDREGSWKFDEINSNLLGVDLYATRMIPAPQKPPASTRPPSSSAIVPVAESSSTGASTTSLSVAPQLSMLVPAEDPAGHMSSFSAPNTLRTNPPAFGLTDVSSSECIPSPLIQGSNRSGCARPEIIQSQSSGSDCVLHGGSTEHDSSSHSLISCLPLPAQAEHPLNKSPYPPPSETTIQNYENAARKISNPSPLDDSLQSSSEREILPRNVSDTMPINGENGLELEQGAHAPELDSQIAILSTEDALPEVPNSSFPGDDIQSAPESDISTQKTLVPTTKEDEPGPEREQGVYEAMSMVPVPEDSISAVQSPLRTLIPNPIRTLSKRVRFEAETSAQSKSVECDIDDAPPAKRLRSSVDSATSTLGVASAVSSPRLSSRIRHAEKATVSPSKFKTKASTVHRPVLSPSSKTGHLNTVPKWLESARSMFESESLGPHWSELIRLWASFEDQENYQEIIKLKATNRPAVVKDWIQRARSATWRPSITNLRSYEKQFLQWWTSLQPEWRVMDGAILFDRLDSSEGDWEDLRRPGINGLLSVMAALFYWGLCIGKKSKERERWTSAVEDCISAMACLVTKP